MEISYPDTVSTKGSVNSSAEAAAFALGVLDELDRPDGDLFPEPTAHQSGFGPVPGGYTWRVVDLGDPSAPSSLAGDERARRQALEQDVIAGLNTAQARLDALERDLAEA